MVTVSSKQRQHVRSPDHTSVSITSNNCLLFTTVLTLRLFPDENRLFVSSLEHARFTSTPVTLHPRCLPRGQHSKQRQCEHISSTADDTSLMTEREASGRGMPSRTHILPPPAYTHFTAATGIVIQTLFKLACVYTRLQMYVRSALSA